MLERPQGCGVCVWCGWISYQYGSLQTTCMGAKSWAAAGQALEGQQLELGTRWSSVAELCGSSRL